MSLGSKIILHCPISDEARLGPFVERCLEERASLLAVMGPGAEELEETIDWIVVGDGTIKGRFLLTTAHPADSLADVMEFAATCTPCGVAATEVRL